VKKTNVGILFGGKSTEHEVSLQSAKSVMQVIDQEKYEIILIGIDKNGQWYLCDQTGFLLNEDNPKEIMMKHTGIPVTLTFGKSAQQLVCFSNPIVYKHIDVIFPVLHGACGEDGTMQGLLKVANIPFVGPSVLGSAIGMDKEVAKRLLRDAGIPIAKFRVYQQWEEDQVNFESIVKELGLPLFVKPANLGSSVGIHKAKNKEEFIYAVHEAFTFDTKILIEEFVEGSEIECAVLGNEKPIASAVGAIIPEQEFYSYDAKYMDEKGATIQIPADISKELVKKIQELAVKSCKVLCCEGMARVDFFLTKENKAIINEINTIPGFTKISMYPKLWEISGIPYSKLIDRLIQLAQDRFKREEGIKDRY
jgi:D-alanine-D-alanine ligase